MNPTEEAPSSALPWIRLGMITPSSNTVVEPTTTAMLEGIDRVSAHFARFRVTKITHSKSGMAQFEPVNLLAAARLLADARVQVITWNGTSAAWKGFAADEELCRRISDETGIPATSSILALNEIFAKTRVTRFGLVTPYVDAVQHRIIENYAAAGFDCTAECHENHQRNFSFAEISEARIAELIRSVAEKRPDAIAVVCTNLRGAAVGAALEAELGIPIYDTVATGLWKSLILAGVSPASITGWGRLFKQPLTAEEA